MSYHQFTPPQNIPDIELPQIKAFFHNNICYLNIMYVYIKHYCMWYAPVDWMSPLIVSTHHPTLDTYWIWYRRDLPWTKAPHTPDNSSSSSSSSHDNYIQCILLHTLENLFRNDLGSPFLPLPWYCGFWQANNLVPVFTWNVISSSGI